MMSESYFVDAHSPEWSKDTQEMTQDYFLVMNDQIQETCGFSILDIVGMSLDKYIDLAAGFMRPLQVIQIGQML